MTNHRRLATWLGTTLGLFSALLLASAAHAADPSDRITEEFHHTYPLTADGRLELNNINGAVHITTWDRPEVKLDAVKSAYSQERLDEAKILVDAESDRISIRTEYPNRDGNWHSNDNPAKVEYTLMVPQKARLDGIELINGSLDITGAAGAVRAECINGHLMARGLSGNARLSTINGHMEAEFTSVPASSMELSSINGSVDLTLPSDAKVELEASTLHGGIDNDFGLHVHDHRWVGHDMRGELGGGGTRIKLSNVNGGIHVHHASDGHALSPVRDLGGSRQEDEI